MSDRMAENEHISGTLFKVLSAVGIDDCSQRTVGKQKTDITLCKRMNSGSESCCDDNGVFLARYRH